MQDLRLSGHRAGLGQSRCWAKSDQPVRPLPRARPTSRSDMDGDKTVLRARPLAHRYRTGPDAARR